MFAPLACSRVATLLVRYPRSFALLAPLATPPRLPTSPLQFESRSLRSRLSLLHVPIFPFTHAAPAVEGKLVFGGSEFLDVGFGFVIMDVVDLLVLGK